MKTLKYIAFGSAAMLIIVLMTATIVEKFGVAAAHADIYRSPLTIALWCAAAIFASLYIIRLRRKMSLPALCLHAAFAVILAGAAVTYLFGVQGNIKLLQGIPASDISLASGNNLQLPFTVRLDTCFVEFYPGTSTAGDYVSAVTFIDHEDTHPVRISMNKIAVHRGYRFYQSAMGEEYSVLAVSHDPWGIVISYTGYLLLGLSMICFFFSKRTRFRSLVSRLGTVLLLIATAGTAFANTDAPPSIPASLAKNLGKINVYWNGRVSPLQTMARDFCLKTYGDVSYRGLSAEQVLAGWLFYYDDWKKTPFIKIKGKTVSGLLDTDTRHVALTDFYSPSGYILHEALAEDISDKALHDVDERIGLVTSVCTGAAIKVFPVNDTSPDTQWLSPVDRMPIHIEEDDYIFLTMAFDRLSREILSRQWKNADDIFTEIIDYQISHAPDGSIPSGAAQSAELIYNKISSLLIPSAFAIVMGLVSFLLRLRIRSRNLNRVICLSDTLLFLWISLLIALRWIIGGHFPISNGYETMMATAWLAFAVGAVAFLAPKLRKLSGIIAPSTLLTGGLALMVAYIGRDGESVSHLMPVLASPLLSVHVLLVMCSYALLTVITVNSIYGLTVRKDTAECTRLAYISATLLYPALFLLTAGIFVGAVWANQSWGRYWGWDPKETWALITMLIYSFALHERSLRWFARPVHLHAYLLAAFLSVLMTYFGVNYLLPGLHSYA